MKIRKLAGRDKNQEIRICVLHGTDRKELLWISLQTEKDTKSPSVVRYPVSIGLLGGFVASKLTPPPSGDYSEEPVIDLAAQHPKTSITNPHFTYHPPNYYHLVADKHKKELVAGLCWAENATGPCGGSTGVDPWIRMISNPISKLPTFHQLRGKTVGILDLLHPSKDCSVAIHFDFVKGAEGDPKIFRYVKWGNVMLRLYAQVVAPQDASLGYFCG